MAKARTGCVEERRLSDGSVRYRVKWLDPTTGKREACTPDGIKTRGEAEDYLATILQRNRMGLVGIVAPTEKQRKQAGITVGELIKKFLTQYTGGAERELRDLETYRASRRTELRKEVAGPLLSIKAVSLTRADVVRQVEKLKAVGASPFVRRKFVRALSRVFSWGLEMEIISCTNPCARISVSQPAKRTDLFYTNEELAKLLAVTKGTQLHDLITFAVLTGQRRGEIAALQVGDVDLERGIITIRRSWGRPFRKSGQPNIIPMHPDLRPMLEARCKGLGGSLLVFPGSGGAMLPRYNNRSQKGSRSGLWGLDIAIQKAKVRRFKTPWHAFRHTTGTMLAASGAPMVAIQAQLGHATPDMTVHYVKLAGDTHREAVAKLALPSLGNAAEG